MADLSGIIPALPNGGSNSQRLQYGSNGQSGYNIIPFNPSTVNQDIYNQTGQLGRYNTPGYLYGYGDLNDPSVDASLQFSRNITPFVAGGKIIPSQYTQTVAQSVGPAQFQMGNQVATQGQPTQDNFTQGPAGPSSMTPGPSNNQTFMFGNNGSAGSISGTMENTAPGQSSPFYQSQPSSMGVSNSNLGTFSSITPQIQALIQSR